MASSVGAQIDFENSLDKARDNVKRMDQIDGFKDRHLRTILLALEAGLRDPSTNAQFDAYVMLAELLDLIDGRD